MKKRIFTIIEKGTKDDILSRMFDWIIMTLIVFNVLAVVLESFNTLKTSFGASFRGFETFSVIIFTVEYVIRIWTADLKYPHKGKLLSRIAFIFSAMAIIDLLAILPFYIPLTTRVDLRALRILRLTRILRILKISRYSNSLALIGRVFKRRKSDLAVTIFVTFLLLLLASSLMYYIENPVQPDKFPNIVATSWWTIVTLTTVGYGDIYPITIVGKILGGIIALLGIGLVALPTGIISSGFMEEVSSRNKQHKDKTHTCPHCGKEIEEI